MNKSFLLIGINAKYIHSNPAIRSLKAYAGTKYASCISLAEYTINNRREEILADIYKRNPDVIGFSVYIWNVTMVKELLPDLAKLLPNTEIYLGGPEVSHEAGHYLKQYSNIRGIMQGEGEHTFKMLLDAYDASGFEAADLSDIPGLLLRTGQALPAISVPMDSLPFLYQSDKKQNELSDEYDNRIIYYESSRGCPFRCSYCLSAIDKTTRFRSLDLVFKELDFFLKNKVKQVKFIDRTFNCNHERTVAIWKYITEHDNSVTNFHFEIAADILTDEEIMLLNKMRPGLVQLEIGVQTTNEQALEAINRPCSISHLKSTVGKIVNVGNVHVHLDLIAGLPYEDYESFKKSFNEVFAMKPNQLQLGFLKILKGAPISNQLSLYGIVGCDAAPYEVLYTDCISYHELLELKKVEQMTEIFYNSAQFTQSLPYLLSFFDSPFDLFKALGDYYEMNNYFVLTPARSRRYNILLEFAAREGGIDSEKLREFLTYDYYLREKPKAKPDFVINIPDRICYDKRDPITGNFIFQP